jgi:hypothetical protein
LIVQVPEPTNETVAADTVQMPALEPAAENATPRPELAVAVTVYVDPPATAPDGADDVKLIDCGLFGGGEAATVNDCCACGAA